MNDEREEARQDYVLMIEDADLLRMVAGRINRLDAGLLLDIAAAIENHLKGEE